MTIKAIKLYYAILNSKRFRVVECEAQAFSAHEPSYELHVVNQYHNKDWYRISWGYNRAQLAIAAVEMFNQSPYLAEKLGLEEYVETKNWRGIEGV